MSNFGFLAQQKDFALFASAAIEAERVYATSTSMCAIGCRKALELAVKWVYAADNTIKLPYKDNLQSLIHEESFRESVERYIWLKLPYIIKLGNLAVHTERNISQQQVLLSLQNLFDFIQWLDYCYGSNYKERVFSVQDIPAEKLKIDAKQVKEQQSLLFAKDEEIEKLRAQIEALSAQYTAAKEQHEHFVRPHKLEQEDITEAQTRKQYIDVDLQLMGWELAGDRQNVSVEYEVNDMGNVYGRQGFIDYVLWGRDGMPLAVIEAKRTSKDPKIGRQQAVLYADALERKFGRRPLIFLTNGFESFFWDDKAYPLRPVSGVFSEDDLEKIIQRRTSCQELETIAINDEITGRAYQKEAIRAVCAKISKGFRKNLLVMATGTGKTRTAASLADVLSRGGYVKNILFLADRTALVKQAKEAFQTYLPDMTLCNLLDNKDEKNSRAVFSTYPTILNAIDDSKSRDGLRLFTPAHFDLIIIDECHRSIFKKYRAIFDYFDALLVGLTATPREDVDRNTYDFFEMENGIPTYAYDYETAVDEDKVLVPYYNIEVKTKFLDTGIKYDELSDKEKQEYEDKFTEDDGSLPDFIPPEQLNKFIFNDKTIDLVLQKLMEQGIKIDSGEKLGRTIIFAQNKRHAERIVERFNKLYPVYKGKFAQRIICEDAYAQTLIDDFKQPDKMPQIAVSVDMLDTGVDIPECVNLVFFKVVRSKTKFWQMIGRGTRLCPELDCVDHLNKAYKGKRYFFIFDYCGNFDFFRTQPNGIEGSAVKTLSEAIFSKKIELIKELQEPAYAACEYQALRSSLVAACVKNINALIDEDGSMRVAVKLKSRYINKFKEQTAFTSLDVQDKGELLEHVAPLVSLYDTDINAKRFDNLLYSLMLVVLVENNPGIAYGRSQLNKTVRALEKKQTITEIKNKLPLIRQIMEPEFAKNANVLTWEKVRQELRDLIKFLDDGSQPIIYTNLEDELLEVKAGEAMSPAYDFEDYKQKVNRYILGNSNNIVIYKLMHNKKLSAQDYKELERLFTQELGTANDYEQAYGATPFGLLIRKIAKLDHDAAMEAFSQFINDASLNDRQIAFVHKVISYVEANGYIDDVKNLMQPPFDKPVKLLKLFSGPKVKEIMDIVQSIKDNAIA